MTDKKTKVYVFSHGHMDIEWYCPMHNYRFWEVEAVDRLIQMNKEDPNEALYVMDGQFFPVKEYLSVKPENEQEVKKLIESGKLKVGPFYTQLDEWLPSGEAIIRNCLKGDRIAREYGGEPMKAGYFPDNFGHPLQIPQILQGFGIDSLIFMRGMIWVSEDFPDEFIYRGVDGSELIAINFRYSYSCLPSYVSGSYEFPFRDLPYYDGYIGYEKYLYSNSVHGEENYIADLVRRARKMVPYNPSGVLLIAVGADHAAPVPGLAKVLARANEVQDEFEFIAGGPDEYIQAVKDNTGEMPVVEQELFGTRFWNLGGSGAHTTRSDLKIHNFATETLLEKYAEPLEAYASLYGGREEHYVQLQEAWDKLMQNHAHDGIHGSSCDEAMREDTVRYEHAKQIAAGVINGALTDISKASECWYGDGEMGLLTYSPSETGTKQAVRVWLPVGDGRVTISDKEGNVYPHQTLWRPDPEINEIGLPMWKMYPARGYEPVLVQTNGKKGFEELIISRNEDSTTGTAVSMARCVPAEIPEEENYGPLTTGEDYLENEWLKVVAKHNMLDIYDKKEKKWYYGQNLLIDTADVGDVWETSPTWIPSETVLSNQFPQKTEILEKGPVRCSMRVSFVMNVPKCNVAGRRSAERVDMPVYYDVYLCAGARRVEIKMVVDNTARDHRLDIRMEPRLDTAVVRSQNTFCTLDRSPLHVFDRSAKNKLPTPKSDPFRDWLSISDGKVGMAFAGKGMYDYMPEEDRWYGWPSVNICLLRALGRMGRSGYRMEPDSGQYSYELKDCQCPGERIFEYAFIPYSVSEEDKEMLGEIDAFLYPPLAHCVLVEPKGALVPQMPFRWDAANIRFSAFKHAEDSAAYILRLYENQGKATKAEIAVGDFSKAALCTLNEEILEEVSIENGKIVVDFEAFEIVTIMLWA